MSSRYTRRSYEEYDRIAAYLSGMASGRKGNYLIFFPSYKMMLDVHEIFRDQYETEWMECILQYPGMNEEKREEFLENFEKPKEGVSVLGFCVMGGIFSEGIDLKHEALIGAAIIGTGLPLVCHEREILKAFYDARQMDGFDYAYRYPGMNKVLQSAGRVIRTQEDRGVVLLLDERFLGGAYKRLFPLEWEQYRVCTVRQIVGEMKGFWGEEGKDV